MPGFYHDVEATLQPRTQYIDGQFSKASVLSTAPPYVLSLFDLSSLMHVRMRQRYWSPWLFCPRRLSIFYGFKAFTVRWPVENVG